MRIQTFGLKGADLDVNVGARTIVTGPNGSGKSTIAEALRIAALGFVPALGRRVDITAGLLVRGQTGKVIVTLDDGRTITRTFERQAGGGWASKVECSWTTIASEHAAEALGLFGRDVDEVAESLDIRELLNTTPQKRAAKLQALLDTGQSADDIMEQVCAYAVQTLASLGTVPEDWRAVLSLVPGWHKEAAQRSGQYLILRDQAEALKKRLGENGLADALAWVNAEKREAGAEARRQSAARTALDQRRLSLPEPDEQERERLQARVVEIDRDIGAIDEVLRQRARAQLQVGRAADAVREAQLRLAELDESQAIYDAVTRPAAEKAAEASEAVIAALQEAERDFVPPVQPEDLAILQARVAECVQQLADLADEPLEDLDALRAHLERCLAASQHPWEQVRRAATAIQGALPASGKVRVACDPHLGVLFNLANVNGPVDVMPNGDFDLDERLAEATRVNEARVLRNAERAGQRELVEQRRAAFARDLGFLRVKHDEAVRAARMDYDARKVEARANVAALTDLIHKAKVVEAALARRPDVEEALRLATEAHAGFCAVLAQTTPDREKLDEDRARANARLAELAAAAATRRELDVCIAAIDRLTARATVFGAFEGALQTVRNAQLAQEGGPLRALLSRALAGAGRAEEPFLRTLARGGIELGWRTAAGREVAIEALCGGEWALFAAFLTAAVVMLRHPAEPLVIVEAAECDERTLDQLAHGLAALGDDAPRALVMTSHEPPVGLSAVGFDVIEVAGCAVSQAA